MKRQRILLVIGIFCLVAALSLTAYNLIDAARAGKQAAKVANELSHHISNNSSVTEDSQQAPTVIIDGVAYLGYLTVPELDLTLPIAAEYNFQQLYTSPALYSGGFAQADAVVAAHNYATHFGRIRTLEVGDELVFVDANGKQYQYTVGWQENILGSDGEHMLQDNGWDLTLFTCSYTKGVRYTLRCLLTEN